MNKSIIELIASEQSASAVSLVEKVLAKKLLKAISEQAKGVARNTYGTVSESFGADEQPEFMNPADNTYAVFFANALKKFGVNGPQDFKDEATKQQFFQYVDNNWKAQDSVQGIASQAPSGATMDQGTQTQLPPTATQPAAPQGPMQTPLDTTQPGTAMAQSNGAALPQGGQNDGSLSGMSPTGNSGGNMGLTPGTGNDPGLDMAQNAQQMGGGTTCQSCGQPMPEPQTCQCCGQPMPAGQPGMPGQPQPGQQVQSGADMGDDDSDPDLEIGDEDVTDDNDQFGQDPDDEQNGGFGDKDPNADPNAMGGGDGNDDDQETDEDGNPIVSDDDDTEETDEDGNPIVSDDDGSGDGDEDSDDEGSDEDDPFSDDDAYSVGPNDFNNSDDDEDQDDDEDTDENGDPDLEVGDDDSDEDDSDDDGYDDEADDDADSDDSDDSDDDGYEDEDDDGGDQVVAPAPAKKKGKNPFSEDFGFGTDNAADLKYITEFLDPMIQKSKGIDNHTHRKAKRAKGDLKQVLQSRNSHLSMLKKRRREILADPGKSDKQKKRAVQYISQLAKRHRGHCKEQAQGIKALHTGKF